MGFNFAGLLFLFLASFLFVFAILVVGRVFRPHNPNPNKEEVYECGERPIGDAWMQFNPRFYLIALIFLIFDVEIAFVFPIATVFKQYVADGNGLLVFVELFIFMAILLLGLVYVWRKGDLMWVKQIRKRRSV
jgi:NADH-quinone oxidoreductase subunit A